MIIGTILIIWGLLAISSILYEREKEIRRIRRACGFYKFLRDEKGLSHEQASKHVEAEYGVMIETQEENDAKNK